MAIITEYPFPKINFEEQSSAPATPSTGAIVVYAKTDGLMYYKDDAGTEYQVGAPGGATSHDELRKYNILGL